MKLVNKYLLIIQALSLDVSVGGVIGAWFIATYLGTFPDVFIYLVFGSTIWLIYTFDHLMDARTLIEKPITIRHQIHWKYSTTIWGVWSFVLIITLLMLFKMPAAILIAGAMLSFIVLIYFISLKLLRGIPVYHKEVIASLIYTTGVFIAPVCNYDGEIGPDLYILFIEFFLLALSNMLIFSIFERDVDEHEGFHSLVISYGESRVKTIALLSIGLVYVIGFTGIIINFQPVFWATQAIMILMNTILVIILSNKKYFIVNSRFRIAGDAIFLLPLIYIFFPNVV